MPVADSQSKPTGGNNEGQALNDYDQMIFQQFMGAEDDGNSLIRNESMQQTGFPQSDPGNPADLGVRKADSAHEQQLIGGEDDAHLPFRPQGGRLPFFDPGTFGTLQGPGVQANAPEGLGLQRQQPNIPPSGLLTDDDVQKAMQQSLEDVAHLQNMQNQLDQMDQAQPIGAGFGGPGAQQPNNAAVDEANDILGTAVNQADQINAGDYMDLPDEEIDPDLQAVLELSRNDK